MGFFSLHFVGKNHKIKFRVLAVFFLLTLDLFPVSAQPSFFRQYELGSSYQPVTINKTTQDPYGRMWIGTSKGLFSFDGMDFIYDTFHDSTSLNITALFCDSNNVWIGFDDGKFAHRSLKSWKKEFRTDTNYHSSITRILTDASHKLWISTYGKGLFIKDGRRTINISVEDGLPGNDIYTIAEGKNGIIWIGTDGGITSCVLQSGKPVLKTYSVKDGLPDEIVRSLLMDESGKLWIGTQDQGVCTFDPESKIFTQLSFSKNWNYGAVTALAIDGLNRLMIGTSGKGILSISLHDNLHPIIYDQSTGYENVKVSDINQDSEGNFWVTSAQRGLDMFPGLFEWVPAVNNEVKNAAQAVLYDNDSNLWFATPDGLFTTKLDSSASVKIFPVKLKEGSQPVITSLYEDHHHHIWVGTFDEGVFFDPSGDRKFTQIKQTDGLANDNVLSISGDETDVWISTFGGVTRCNISHDINGQRDLIFKNFTAESGLHSNYVYQTFIDSKSRVWFATDGNGLRVFDKGMFKTYSIAGDIPINTVYSITEDKKGDIWFSTPADGIFRFDGEQFIHYGLESGISDLSITGIVADRNYDIVILENDGIEIFENLTNQIRHYRGKPLFDDLTPNLNSFYRDPFGNIWIATKKGILKYYAPSIKFSHEAQLEIRQVSVYLEPIDFTQIHRLKFNQNYLTFDFQAFWNSNPSQLRYRYKLEGHDLDWITTKDERAIYPELGPGTYTFKIQATIHHNFNDAPTQTYTFTINPPFWSTWWFITCCTIAAVMVMIAGIRMRDKRREREEKLKRERIEFQLENLKSQINPHFLFNSFNTLATLVEEDQQMAVSYIDHLADFYRSLLSFKDTDLVTLKEELQLTENYIFLLRQRHGDRLIMKKNIFDEDLTMLIPPLTLQILIENAVKHNIVSKEKPLTIEVFTTDQQFICVRNNLQKKKDVESTKFGLQNIRIRCELLGSKSFQVKETDSFFQICVPLFPA